MLFASQFSRIDSLVIVRAISVRYNVGGPQNAVRESWRVMFSLKCSIRVHNQRTGNDYLYLWWSWKNVWILSLAVFVHTLWGRKEKSVSHMCDFVVTRSVVPLAWTWKTFKYFQSTLFCCTHSTLLPGSWGAKITFYNIWHFSNSFIILAVRHENTSTGIVGKMSIQMGKFMRMPTQVRKTRLENSEKWVRQKNMADGRE